MNLKAFALVAAFAGGCASPTVEVITCERVPVSPMFTRIECDDGSVRVIEGCPKNAVEVADYECECIAGFNMTFVDEVFTCIEAT